VKRSEETLADCGRAAKNPYGQPTTKFGKLPYRQGKNPHEVIAVRVGVAQECV